MGRNYPHTTIKKILGLSLLMVFITACGGTLKSSWLNFRAYYNTYYNAEQSFRVGLTKVQEQPVQINPEELVRIHPPTVQAGNSNFKEAIDKSARILRKFRDSKWLDDALLLIGKSYYYRHEYYRAKQKFEELRNATDSPEMIQKAIIWKGRTLLDLQQYSNGISFLETEVSQYPQNWSVVRQGEIRTLLAQHYAMQSDWSRAEVTLSKAITYLEEKKIRGRSYFLYGQILEKLERYGEAFYAYSLVPKYFPSFEYVYWAGVKQGDVARKQANFSQALSIYAKLRRDDKNYDRIEKLNYKIARTLEMQGAISAAEKSYKELLSQNAITQTLKGKVYYRLGKIYSENYEKFNVAAAYFDSSATVGSQNEIGQNRLSAETLADAYGEYTRLRNKVEHADSLLWLGSLSAEELNSVVAELKEQKRQEIRAERENKKTEKLVNQSINTSGSNKETRSSIHGFLNYQNNEFIQQGKREFRIIWGNRPLADNWRRIQALGRVDSEQNTAIGSNDNRTAGSRRVSDGITVNIDLEAIPKSSEAQKKLKEEKATALYELGNLLFVNLGMPDSASTYFRDVIKSEVNSDLRPQAMYSLYEIYNSEDRTDSLKYWGNRILVEYPQSRYAYMVRSDRGNTQESFVEDSSSAMLKKEYQRLVSSKKKVVPGKLRNLALKNRSSEIAPYIYYHAIEEYARRALVEDDLSTVQQHGRNDSTQLGKVESGVRDSMRIRSKSMYWDSVRIAINEFDTVFTNAKQRSKVKRMKSFLRKQESEQKATCEKLGLSLKIDPSMEAFLSKVEYPDELKGGSLSGKLIYSFLVDKKGNFESFKLLSNRTPLGIEEAFETAFDKYLQFKPFEGNEIPSHLRCKVSFPIQQ
ncbi:tetratricopeptide repeat protein [Fodinibius saliphilus]|uniref:type IX secretion system periplasmic lipoprotein PorW/SprE n=1 Tax=Fodinibius saliphilus TaxID=1920650 RepID=UPI0011087B0D|nr:tetratricopeptide repeat protein [Fodinibius saliphilus]